MKVMTKYILRLCYTNGSPYGEGLLTYNNEIERSSDDKALAIKIAKEFAKELERTNKVLGTKFSFWFAKMIEMPNLKEEKAKKEYYRRQVETHLNLYHAEDEIMKKVKPVSEIIYENPNINL